MTEAEPIRSDGRSLGQARVNGVLGRAISVVLATVLGLGLGLALTASRATHYESSARLLVGPIGADRSTLDAAGLLARTYADVVSRRGAVDDAVEPMGLDAPDEVSAVANEATRVILLTVRDEDRTVPPRVVDALGANLIAFVEGDAGGLGGAEAGAPGQVRVIEEATDPAVEVQDSTLVVVVGCGLLGLLVGLAWAGRSSITARWTVHPWFIEERGLVALSIRHRLRDSAQSALQEFRDVVGFSDPFDIDRRSGDHLDLAMARLLREWQIAGPCRTACFVPVDLDPRAAQVVLGLAFAAARMGRSVVVCDADVEHPDLGILMGMVAGDGRDDDPPFVTTILGPHAKPIVREGRTVGWLLPGGGSVRFFGSVGGEIADGGMARLQRASDLVTHGEVLFVLTPPVGESPLSVSSAVVADRTTLLVRRNRTHKRYFDRVLAVLAALDVVPTGVIEIETAPRGPTKGLTRRLRGRSSRRPVLSPYATGDAPGHASDRGPNRDELGVDVDADDEVGAQAR